MVAIVGPGVRGEGSIMSINRYKQRDEVLRSIGFQSYKEYLESDLWKSIRSRVLKRSYKKKYLLGKGNLRLAMKPICGKCHKEIEFDGQEKTSLGRANEKLADIAVRSKEKGVRIPVRHLVKNRIAQSPVSCLCGQKFSNQSRLDAHLRTSRKCSHSLKNR